MEFNAWSICNREYDPQRRASRDALFTTGNGYFGVRGFFEEERQGIAGLGGIYMAGVFGKGAQSVCTDQSRELCNLPQLLRLDLTVNGAPVHAQNNDFSQTLELAAGVYTRRYRFVQEGQPVLELCFERFAHLEQMEQVWQRVAVKALQPAELQLYAGIDSAVTNLNLESCEPWPIQPGRDHITAREVREQSMTIVLDDADSTRLELRQIMRFTINGAVLAAVSRRTETETGAVAAARMQPGDVLVLEKAAAVQRAEEAQRPLPDTADYSSALQRHTAAWEKRWQACNMELDSPVRDVCALRYNLFQLMAACPLHTDAVSIGARGLSGEMYEGCVFWDNEIFQLPFFCWSDPESARRLLQFRIRTLPAARRRAQELWFDGALYPWQVSEKGEEQTIQNGGAYYAIHITADIVFAMLQYIQITGDASLLRDGGAELIVETARFWVSRIDTDADGTAHIRCVRGPNEYDVYVDDNAYTNIMARENLLAADLAADWMRHHEPKAWDELCGRLQVSDAELAQMQQLAHSLYIPTAEDGLLVLEDSRYACRRPMDMKKAKPTGKRIIDSTLPYEALPLYQVTKQADIVLLMALMPHRFSAEQKRRAYEYYEPRTAHDSSLSYAPHSWLCAQLGDTVPAYAYFEKSALLDVEDRQMNTVSGIHFANFGGTWQAVFSGFFGITQDQGVLHVRPHLPQQWKGFSVRCCYQNRKFEIGQKDGLLFCRWLDPVAGAVQPVTLAGHTCTLTGDRPVAEVKA